MVYVFVTYGEPGWRGVQVRGLRIAKYFDKKDVLFFNGIDSGFIRKHGYRCKTIDLSLVQPSKIKFPKETKAVIFADLPTNELYNFSLFVAAKERGIPVVIFDNLYRRGQTQEGVYRKLLEYCDLMVLNGLGFMKSEENEKIRVVGPRTPEKIKKGERKRLCENYGIDPEKPIVFVAGYHPDVLRKAKKINDLLSKSIDYSMVISGTKKLQRKGNLLMLPYVSDEEYFKWLGSCDVFICKFGYLQILEALVLGKPVVVTSEVGYVLRMEILDKRIQEVIKYFEKVDESLIEYLKRLLSGKEREKLVKKILKLSSPGREEKDVIEEIKKLKFSFPRKIKKKLIILVNSEVKKYEKMMEKEFLFPVILILPTSKGKEISAIKRPDERVLDLSLSSLNIGGANEILPHSFKLLYLFSRRKYDGFVDIIPFYSEWVKGLFDILKKADEILVTQQSKKLLKNLLLQLKNKKIITLK